MIGKKNTDKCMQICLDSEYGVLSRRAGKMFFYQNTDEKHLKMLELEHVVVERINIPDDMIKPRTGMIFKDMICEKCEGKFPASEMERKLCRACFCRHGSDGERWSLSIDRFADGRSSSVMANLHSMRGGKRTGINDDGNR